MLTLQLRTRRYETDVSSNNALEHTHGIEFGFRPGCVLREWRLKNQPEPGDGDLFDEEIR